MLPWYYYFMILVIHITVAIVSVLTSFLTVLSPTRFKIQATQLLTLLTLVSGAVLVILHPANLGKSCISGILYFGLVSLMAAISNKRFAAMKGNISL